MFTKLKHLALKNSILIAYLSLLLAPPISGEELNFVATEWPPYNGSDLKGNGFSPQLIKTIFSQHNFDVQVIILPWAS